MLLQEIVLHKVLVPIDGSKASYKALSHAVYIAKHNKIELTLLYVVDLNKEVSDFERVSLSGYVPENIKSKGIEILNKLAKEIPQEIKVNTSIEIGFPTEVIVEKAKNENYDIIVMGSRGLGKIKSIFMGSVSQYVLKYAHCPVLIVR
ncbi:Putative universal stress protein SAV1710 [Megamonas hypermegale]|uniref:Putative universal stress protein SAV1710 n=1 Tax=Megamonas hypermegale TaxID=158847 RepID=A0A239TXY6_9FIRM|nr:universal stress protein [Megamonas hypermegale]SNV02422.1 Putative universal stress protein SAV1710 [Megamonas hypermegale]